MICWNKDRNRGTVSTFRPLTHWTPLYTQHSTVCDTVFSRVLSEHEAGASPPTHPPPIPLACCTVRHGRWIWNQLNWNKMVPLEMLLLPVINWEMKSHNFYAEVRQLFCKIRGLLSNKKGRSELVEKILGTMVISSDSWPKCYNSRWRLNIFELQTNLHALVFGWRWKPTRGCNDKWWKVEKAMKGAFLVK